MRVTAKEAGDWNKAVDLLIERVEEVRVLTNELLAADRSRWNKILFIAHLKLHHAVVREAHETADLLLGASKKAKDQHAQSEHTREGTTARQSIR